MKYRYPIVAAAICLGAPTVAAAHFVLHSPAPTLEQNRVGDPQKLAPCGGTSANPGVATGAVTEVRGGALLHVRIEETVFHPGHYRVALARTQNDLPADPTTITRESERGPLSVSAAIEARPQPPVLADGLFVHTSRQAPGSFWETDVKIPNVDCADCVFQVIQWMGEHGHNIDGDYSYHHCAAVRVTVDPKLPRDRAWTRALAKVAK